MEKEECPDHENCFICSEFMGPFKNELTVLTGFSERPLHEILGEIAAFFLVFTNYKIKMFLL
jgi:hypothetical protein